MGLSMFGPALEAGEGEARLFATVVGGAFCLYCLAKVMLGLVALALGAAGWRLGNGAGRIFGVLGALSGIASIAFNAMAMVDSKSWMFAAGAAGTAATALVGVLLLMRSGNRGPNA